MCPFALFLFDFIVNKEIGTKQNPVFEITFILPS